MRPAFAVPFVIAFAILFVVAIVVSRVVNTAGNPDEVAGVINDADLYDFAYDRVLEAALTDITTQGIVLSNEDGTERRLEFEDPARAHATLKSFIEAILPREYVQQKIEETLDGVIPYVSGRTDRFAIDLETSERIQALPAAVGDASERIGLGELVVTSLLVPAVRDISDSVTTDALGISLTADEAEAATRMIAPPEWIESQIVSVVEQSAPYFAGTEDDLYVVIDFRDRVPVAGEVLKAKLNDENTLAMLVFDQVVDPLVAAVVADSTNLVFGVQVTETELQTAMHAVAPDDWIRAQGDGVIDSLVAWLVGATPNLSYTVDLEQRKLEAAAELETLAIRKLDEQIAATPICQGPFQATQALNDALNNTFPSCLPENSSAIVDVMQPVIAAEIRSFVEGSLPDQIAYTDADLRSKLGFEQIDMLYGLRDQITGGLVFTDQDLVSRLAADESPEAIASARETLDIVRAGFVFDQSAFTDRMDSAQLSRFNDVRSLVDRGWTLRWIVFVPAVLLLIVVALIGGKNWAGRARWAGASLAVTAFLFFGVVQVGWASTSSLREINLPTSVLSAENQVDYPTLSVLLLGDEFRNMVERVGSAWVSSLAMSAVPWAVVGVALFVGGWLYPQFNRKRVRSIARPGGDSGPGRRFPGLGADEPVSAIGDVVDEDDSGLSKPEEAA